MNCDVFNCLNIYDILIYNSKYDRLFYLCTYHYDQKNFNTHLIHSEHCRKVSLKEYKLIKKLQILK